VQRRVARDEKPKPASRSATRHGSRHGFEPCIAANLWTTGDQWRPASLLRALIAS
jgi:hypothetical protein